MDPGLNLEFARDEHLDLPAAMRAAAAAGYRFVEPFVHVPVRVEVNSHLTITASSAYHHIHADNPGIREVRKLCSELGLRLSALDTHTSLLLPSIGIPQVRRALDLAGELDCPIVMSDEGPVCEEVMGVEASFDLLCTSLETVVRHAQARGVRFALELHNAITASPEYLERLLSRFGPAELGVNFDTGNAFLAGNDPVEYLRRVVSRVVHVHLKDIPASQLDARGKVTGTRVGVAAGHGVVALGDVVSVLARHEYTGVLSVECGTLADAESSLPALQEWIRAAQTNPPRT